MTTETITEYEVTERDVEMAICDECGCDIGPLDDDDTRVIPLVADPTVEFDPPDVDHLLRTLTSNEWNVTERYDKNNVELEKDFGILDKPYNDTFYAQKDVREMLEWVVEGFDGPTIHGAAKRDLCETCAPDDGFAMTDDGTIYPSNVSADYTSPEEITEEIILEEIKARYGSGGAYTKLQRIRKSMIAVTLISFSAFVYGVVAAELGRAVPEWYFAAMFVVCVYSMAIGRWTEQ